MRSGPWQVWDLSVDQTLIKYHCKLEEEINQTSSNVFAENGLVAYKSGKYLASQSILKHLGEEKIQKIINFSLWYMSQLQLPFKRGHFIDFRTGIINLCPVGQSCSQVFILLIIFCSFVVNFCNGLILPYKIETCNNFQLWQKIFTSMKFVYGIWIRNQNVLIKGRLLQDPQHIL